MCWNPTVSQVIQELINSMQGQGFINRKSVKPWFFVTVIKVSFARINFETQSWQLFQFLERSNYLHKSSLSQQERLHEGIVPRSHPSSLSATGGAPNPTFVIVDGRYYPPHLYFTRRACNFQRTRLKRSLWQLSPFIRRQNPLIRL